MPEETLNVLITVMSERELHVPRLGRIVADPGFRLVAAMNPFDAVGTARISSAVYDRVCRLSVDYQSAKEEEAIVLAGRADGRRPLAGEDRRARPAHPLAPRPARRLVGARRARRDRRRVVARRAARAADHDAVGRPRRHPHRPVRPGAPARGLAAHDRGDHHRAVGRGLRHRRSPTATVRTREKRRPRRGLPRAEGGPAGPRRHRPGQEVDDVAPRARRATTASTRSRPTSASSTRRRSTT